MGVQCVALFVMLVFANLPSVAFVQSPCTGTYTFAVTHDKNMNDELNTNLLAIPTEGYGFHK